MRPTILLALLVCASTGCRVGYELLGDELEASAEGGRSGGGPKGEFSFGTGGDGWQGGTGAGGSGGGWNGWGGAPADGSNSGGADSGVGGDQIGSGGSDSDSGGSDSGGSDSGGSGSGGSGSGGSGSGGSDSGCAAAWESGGYSDGEIVTAVCDSSYNGTVCEGNVGKSYEWECTFDTYCHLRPGSALAQDTGWWSAWTDVRECE